MATNKLINSLYVGGEDVGVFGLPYGECTTLGASVAKEVQVQGDFALEKGAMVVVKFTYANAAASPTLNVNGTGAIPILRYAAGLKEDGSTSAQAAVSTTASSSGWRAGTIQMFVYDGTSWVRDFWENTTYSNPGLGHGYGTCSTAAATAAKTASISSYTLSTGGIAAIKFTNGNTATSNVTLNISSKGAKPIYYQGAALTDGTLIKANDTITFMYSDGKYHLISIDRDKDEHVTAAQYHYTPTTDTNSKIAVGASSTTAASWNSTSLVTGVTIERDSKGHVTNMTLDSVKMPALPTETAVTITDKSSDIIAKEDQYTKYVVTNLVEGGTKGHAITPTYTEVATKAYVDRLGTVLKYVGVTTTNIKDESTTNPITIGGKSYTAVTGDVVIYQTHEYVWVDDGTPHWELFGQDGNYSLVGHQHGYSGTTEKATLTPAGTVTSSFTGDSVEHTHTIGALTANATSSTVDVGSGTHTHNVPALKFIGTEASHTHTFGATTSGNPNQTAVTAAPNAHTHSITVSGGIGNNTSGDTVSKPAHTHTIPQLVFKGTQAGHTHTITGSNFTFTGTGATHSHSIPELVFTGTDFAHTHSIPKMKFTGNEASHSHTIPAISITSTGTTGAVSNNVVALSATVTNYRFTISGTHAHTHSGVSVTGTSSATNTGSTKYTPTGSISTDSGTLTNTGSTTHTPVGTITVGTGTSIGNTGSKTLTPAGTIGDVTTNSTNITPAGTISTGTGTSVGNTGAASTSTGHTYDAAAKTHGHTFTGDTLTTGANSGTGLSVAPGAHTHTTAQSTTGSKAITPRGSIVVDSATTDALTATSDPSDTTTVATGAHTHTTTATNTGKAAVKPTGTVTSTFKGTAANHTHTYNGTVNGSTN